MKHKAKRVDNLMYKGCEPHWRCILCGDAVPFRCYTKEEFENRCCGCHKINATIAPSKPRKAVKQMRERLIELIQDSVGGCARHWAEIIADNLLANGVIVTKKIIGYEDYSIDEYGNVYSYKSRRYVSQQKQKDGYYYVGLCKDGKRKSFAVHRLVAMHFIENPNCFPKVNHKDENKENNDAANLEWCDEKYNTNYGTARKRHAEKVSRPVVCIETGKVFLSQLEAGKTISVSHRHICDCIKDKRRTCGGYHWRYASREEAEKALKEDE